MEKNKPSELAMENIRRMWPRVVGRSRGSRWAPNANITQDLQAAGSKTRSAIDTVIDRGCWVALGLALGALLVGVWI